MGAIGLHIPQHEALVEWSWSSLAAPLAGQGRLSDGQFVYYRQRGDFPAQLGLGLTHEAAVWATFTDERNQPRAELPLGAVYVVAADGSEYDSHWPHKRVERLLRRALGQVQ